jgi:hypothetical protein
VPSNPPSQAEIKERLTPDVMQQIVSNLGAELPPINQTECIKQCVHHHHCAVCRLMCSCLASEANTWLANQSQLRLYLLQH